MIYLLETTGWWTHLEKYRDDELIAWLEFKLFGIIDLFHGVDPGKEEFADRVATYLEKKARGRFGF